MCELSPLLASGSPLPSVHSVCARNGRTSCGEGSADHLTHDHVTRAATMNDSTQFHSVLRRGERTTQPTNECARGGDGVETHVGKCSRAAATSNVVASKAIACRYGCPQIVR